MSDEEGIGLTDREITALAWCIVANRVADPEYWLEWEDYPNLGEYAFEALNQQVAAVASEIGLISDWRDRLMDINSRELLERTAE